jgi:hypothetical protein
MLDWFSETMLKIVMSVPALLVAEDSPTFTAVRVMFGLILIVLVAYVIAMRPFRSAIARAIWEGVHSIRAETPKMMPACWRGRS